MNKLWLARRRLVLPQRFKRRQRGYIQFFDIGPEPAAGGTLRSDNFDRANGAIGTPSDAGSAWSETTAGWEVISNRAGFGNPPTVYNGVASLEASATDVIVQATFSVINSSPNAICGLAARFSDMDNHWRVFYIHGSTTVRLQKRVATSTTNMGDWVGTLIAGDVITLEVDASDNWTVRVNTTSRITNTDSDLSTNTKHGLYANFNSGPEPWRVDDFSISSN